MANHCNLCGEEMLTGWDGLDEWKITVSTWSNYNSQESEYAFHQRCYERGKTQLIGAVADADCLGATIHFDRRDPERSMDKSSARSAQIRRTVDAIEPAIRTYRWLAVGLIVIAVPIFFLHGWLCWLGIVPLTLGLGLLWLVRW